MEDFQQRVVDEKSELDIKFAKLDAFLKSPAFNALPTDEKSRLQTQQFHMIMYSYVLAARIVAFGIL